jgi:phosphate transport system permease protein
VNGSTVWAFWAAGSWYTAGWSASLPTGKLTGSPVGYLTYPIWTFYNIPSKSAQDLSYDAAFLLIVFLLLIVAGRLVTLFARRHSEST